MQYLRYFLFLLALILVWFSFSSSPEDNAAIDHFANIDPEKEYQIVFWDQLIPLTATQDIQSPDQLLVNTRYMDLVSEALKDFSALYPNIFVEYILISPAKAEEKLAEALKKGNPPDVYTNLYHGPVLSSLQIPIDGYLSGEELTSYLPAALKEVTYADHLWGFPRWLNYSAYITKHEYTEDLSPWDFDNIPNILSKSKAQYGLVYHPLQTGELFRDLITLLKQPYPFQPNGTPAWSEATIQETAELLLELNSTNSLVISEKAHQLFVTERALFLPAANTNSLNTKEILNNYAFIQGSHLLIFRQENYKGSDHTRAAIEFARFFSRYETTFFAKELNVIPSYLDPQEVISWADYGLNPGWQDHSTQLYPKYHANPDLRVLEITLYQDILPPLILKLLKKELTSQEFTLELLEALNILASQYQQGYTNR